MGFVESLTTNDFQLRFQNKKEFVLDQITQQKVKLHQVSIHDPRDLNHWHVRRDLIHKVLPTIYDMVGCDTKTYIVEKYIEGNKLTNVHMPPEFFWALADQLISAVNTLHKVGLVHGQIDRKKVLVITENGLDFVLVGDGQISGTSPEKDMLDLGWLLIQVYRGWDDITVNRVKNISSREQPFANGNKIERFLGLMIKQDPEQRLTSCEAGKFVEYYNSVTE
jgi:hypothetical protein